MHSLYRLLHIVIFGLNAVFAHADNLAETKLLVHNYDQQIELKNTSEAILTERFEATVYSLKGEKYMPYTYALYDDLIDIQHIEIIVKDISGKTIKKIKKKDFIDRVIHDGISLYTDNRVLIPPLRGIEPPFKIEMEKTVKYDLIMSLPHWRPIKSDGILVGSSSFTVQLPKDLEIKYRLNKVDQPDISYDHDIQVYKWKLGKHEAFSKLSEFDADIEDVIPWVQIVPTKFEYKGISGGFESWDNFAKFLDALRQGTTELPKSVREEIKKLTIGINTNEEKIKVVYDYLQQRSRYVSIQLGIGGWRPTEAAVVHESQYGDCKALSNYTQALLNEVGVQSLYTVIYAGEDAHDYVDPGFPSNSFNHAVLMVPVEKDTILLECTSQSSPPGYRSPFTSGRYALATNKNGGSIIKTPEIKSEYNYRHDSIFIKINEDGVSELSAHSIYSGRYSDIYQLNDYSKKDQLDWISESFIFGQFDIKDWKVEVKDKGDWNYISEFYMDLHSSNFALKSGNRLFVPITAFRQYGYSSLPDSLQYKFVLSDEENSITITTIETPEGYQPETSIDSKSIESEFGDFELVMKYSQDESTMTVERRIKLNSGEFPREFLEDFRSFLKDIRRAEAQSMVFVKN